MAGGSNAMLRRQCFGLLGFALVMLLVRPHSANASGADWPIGTRGN
jgi:hypothetical protein